MKIYHMANNGPYYHASRTPLEIGTILTPEQGKYATNFANEPTHIFLEQQKPSHMLSRFNAVFVFKDLYHLFNGGYVANSATHIYEVEPLGQVEMHNAEWVSHLDSIMYRYLKGDPYEHIPPRDPSLLQDAKQTAQDYWNGVDCHYASGAWEYLTPSAKVIKEVTSSPEEFSSLKEEHPMVF